MNTNPLITTAAISSIIGAVIALLIAFGVPMTPEQQTAILGFVAVLSPWAVAWVGHNTTTPLVAPKDPETGMPLTGPNGEPTVAQTRAALKM